MSTPDPEDVECVAVALYESFPDGYMEWGAATTEERDTFWDMARAGIAAYEGRRRPPEPDQSADLDAEIAALRARIGRLQKAYRGAEAVECGAREYTINHPWEDYEIVADTMRAGRRSVLHDGDLDPVDDDAGVPDA